jgi:CNT family concentrative nucleoside transporter
MAMSEGLSKGLDVDSAGADGGISAAAPGDVEAAAAGLQPGGEPAGPPEPSPSQQQQQQGPGLVATALEKSGVANGLALMSKAGGDAKGAVAARWEADKSFRSACGGVAGVCFLLVFVFHLLPNLKRLVALLGMAAIVGGCYAASSERAAVSWPRILSSLGLQLIMGVLIAYTSVYYIFLWLGEQVTISLSYANEGGQFVFGSAVPVGALEPSYVNITSTEGTVGGGDKVSTIVSVVTDVGAIPMAGNFAMGVLPSIIFFSAFVEVANHVGVLPLLMKIFATLFCAFTGCTIPEGVSAAANVFVGMTNAPLLIKPFMQVATPSHLVSIMGAGFGTAGAAMLPVYISMGAPPVHLLAAAWMGAPASLTCAKLLMPDSRAPGAAGVGSDFTIDSVRPEKCQNMLEAIARGVNDGTAISIGVAANLIAIIGLVAFANGVVGWITVGIGLGPGFTLDRIFGYIFTPLAMLMGVDSDDYVTVGCLLGQKTLLNEFVAVRHTLPIYPAAAGPCRKRCLTLRCCVCVCVCVWLRRLCVQFQNVDTIQNGNSDEFDPMTERSLNIVTYALCGFSNIGSVGMTMSAMTAIAPSQTRKYKSTNTAQHSTAWLTTPNACASNCLGC